MIGARAEGLIFSLRNKMRKNGQAKGDEALCVWIYKCQNIYQYIYREREMDGYEKRDDPPTSIWCMNPIEIAHKDGENKHTKKWFNRRFCHKLA